MMKTKKIYMNDWLTANARNQTQPADKWYVDFANRLLPLIDSSPLYAGHTFYDLTQTAIRISLYFYDTIAQSGGWKVFCDKYRQLYHQTLPFYECTDYIDDEINLPDVCLLLWDSLSQPALLPDEDHPELQAFADLHAPFHFQNPYDKELLELAGKLYDEMDSLFEEAPIGEIPSPDSWMMNSQVLETPSLPLPEITPDSRLTKDVERCLKYSNGYPLLYFATYRELHTFLTQELKWEDHPDGLLADLKDEKNFVIYANAKGMLMAPGVAACFCDARNAAYHASTAAAEAYKLFCLPGHCPFDLLKYGMQHGLLPDAQLPFPQGKEVLQNNWDFITRYFLDEYYEGE